MPIFGVRGGGFKGRGLGRWVSRDRGLGCGIRGWWCRRRLGRRERRRKRQSGIIVIEVIPLENLVEEKALEIHMK